MKAGDMVKFIREEGWMDGWGGLDMFKDYWFIVTKDRVPVGGSVSVKTIGGPIQKKQPGRVFYVDVNSLAKKVQCPMGTSQSLEKRSRVDDA